MAASSIVLAHLAIFRMRDLVQGGVCLAVREFLAAGDTKVAATLLGCNRANADSLLALTEAALPELSGPTVWAPRKVRSSRKELEVEIELAIVQALRDFGSTYEIADFYQTNPTLIQRRLRLKDYAGPGTGESGSGR
jgi:hypothetical protein